MLKIITLSVSAFLLLIPLATTPKANAQSLDIPSSRFGISFGNSANFTGLRINWADKQVEHITGVNITLWRADDNPNSQVDGISLGLVPEAGTLNGLQAGILGAVAQRDLNGFSFGILGAGAGNSINGIVLGGLGAGAGDSFTGIAIGGLGVGAGADFTGIAIGGLGAGSGGDATGILIGGLGAGASGSLSGFSFGLLGAGAGENVSGIQFGGLGVGAGNDLRGFSAGVLGVGCGNHLQGVAIGGIGAGAPKISGLAVGGIGVGGENLTGAMLALGMIRVEDHGQLTGFSSSAFNYIRGRQVGFSIAIVNYADELEGVQMGLVNYAGNNPKWAQILPLLNMHFD